MRENEWFNKVLLRLSFVFLITIIFFVSVDSHQYLITETFWLKNEINLNHNTIFLLILIFIFSLINLEAKIVKWHKFPYLVAILFLIATVTHQKYVYFYNNLQQYPKINGVNKNWGIHGSWVKITGRNFGEGWRVGEVYLGKTKMTIKKWEDKEIIFEIPVNVEKGKQNLEILNAYGKRQKDYFEFDIKSDLEEINKAS